MIKTEDQLLDTYSKYELRIKNQADKYRNEDHDPAIYYLLINPIIADAARELEGTERTPVIEYLERYWGDKAKFHALKRFPELDSNHQVNGNGNGKKQMVFDAYDFATIEPEEPDQIIEECFDTGDKMCIIGPSKTRKSFFALQMAICLATGEGFLHWPVVKPRKVFLAQQEITPRHYHRRVFNMARSMGVDVDRLKGQLKIINTRGTTVNFGEMAGLIKEHQSDVIIFDPLYKLLQGDENSAQDMKPLLAQFDQLAEKSGAAVVYVHHDTKGLAGAKQLQDRGSGSNVLGRDYDASFFLTEHDGKDDTLVIETIFRNYAPQEAKCIGWEKGRFLLSTAAPTVQTMPTKTRSKGNEAGHRVKALELLVAGPLPISLFRDEIKDQLGLSARKQAKLVEQLDVLNCISIDIIEGRGGKKEVSITAEGTELITAAEAEKALCDDDEDDLI